MSLEKSKPLSVGLALGGGAARGWAHIGVIRALEEAGISIDSVAGTSIGALVGAIYCSGRLKELERIADEFHLKQLLYFVDVVFPRSGLIDGKKIVDFIKELTGSPPVEELSIPFCAIATDLATGREVRITEGDLLDAVRASISIPGIFTPLVTDGRILVDGGLVNPVPVDATRELGADFVVAVDLNYRTGRIKLEEAGKKARRPLRRNRLSRLISERLHIEEVPGISQIREWFERTTPTIFDIVVASISLMEVEITRMRLEETPPELLIRPELSHVNFFEFHRAKEIIAEGYRAALEALGKTGMG